MISPAYPRWLLLLPVAAAPAALLDPRLAALPLAAFAFTLLFFRDPEREPEGPGIVSPADGVVDRVEATGDGALVSVFMRLRDVHVNRVPLDGDVRGIEYTAGRFRPAFTDTSRNERNLVELSTPLGDAEVEQVAGTFARRIRCFLEPGQSVERGQRLGIIAFSSRVNLKLPVDPARLDVSEGDTVKAGETLLLRER